jgi:hypothetical protein
VGERTIGKWLRKLKLTRLQPRPFHPKKDEAAQQAFKKRPRVAGPPVASETGRATLPPEGSGRKVGGSDPVKNVAHGLLRTCEW